MSVTRYKGGKCIKQESQKWKEKKIKLIEQLGAKCVFCKRTENLQFDHIRSIQWEPEKLSKLQRINIYYEALDINNLQLLCSSCHGKNQCKIKLTILKNNMVI